jgi:AraC family transcriptional regulator
MTKEASLEAYRARLARALAYVQGNLQGEVSLEGAAEAACFSKYHFHRIFSGLVGESFADYVRRLRLERAALLLEQRPAMSVTEAALASGFSSPSVFSRDFAERFGLPPSAWREERRPGLSADGGARCWGERSPQEEAALPGLQGLEVKELGPFHFASILALGGYGPAIGEAWGRLCRWAGPRGLLGPGSVSAGLAWDSPDITEPARCRYSVCLSCPPALELSGEVVPLEFAPRKHLVLSYRGPDLSKAYTYLYKQILPVSGFEPEDSPALEFYRAAAQSMKTFDLEIALPVHPLE